MGDVLALWKEIITKVVGDRWKLKYIVPNNPQAEARRSKLKSSGAQQVDDGWNGGVCVF